MEPEGTIRIAVFGNPDYSQSRRMLATAYAVAADHCDVQVDHVDVWQEPERAVARRVRTVPTTLILVAGTERERLSGRRSAHALARAVYRATASGQPGRPVAAPSRSPLQR